MRKVKTLDEAAAAAERKGDECHKSDDVGVVAAGGPIAFSLLERMRRQGVSTSIVPRSPRLEAVASLATRVHAQSSEISDKLMFVLQIGGWVIFSCGLMSFIEHQVHRKLMHRPNFPRRHTAAFKRVFEAHAIVHHQLHYSRIFSDEPVPPGEDKEIRLTLRKAPIKGFHLRPLLVSRPGREPLSSWR